MVEEGWEGRGGGLRKAAEEGRRGGGVEESRGWRWRRRMEEGG